MIRPMSELLINKEIVEERKRHAPEMRDMLQKAEGLLGYLRCVNSSPILPYRPEACESLILRLESLCERLRIKANLFDNGMVTVAVAGVEKSGKTTMLKNLTGIDNLPTAAKRCTSVSCEIHYAEEGEREYLEVNYYTPEELLNVIRTQWEYITGDKGIWHEGREFTLDCPTSLEAFRACTLPSVDNLTPENVMSYEDAVGLLHGTRTALASYKNELGKTIEADLSTLSDLASHQGESNKQPIIRKIIVHKRYEKGSPALRLCDTPGVDDPNPQALERTLLSIREEADMLVVANRPLNMPSITGPLSRFIGKLRHVDQDAPLRDRTIFFVNWHKEVDKEHKYADERIEEVRKKNVFTDIYGPCDVMDEAELDAFLKHLNNRLRAVIPAQDKALLEKLRHELKEVQVDVSAQVHRAVREMTPQTGDDYRQKNKEFRVWLNSNDQRGAQAGENFINRLNSTLVSLSTEASKDAKVDELQKRIIEIRDQKIQHVVELLKNELNADKLGTMLAERRDPSQEALPILLGEMQSVVEELTEVVQEVGPFIQAQVWKAIESALGKNVADRLCAGSDERPAERIQALCRRLELNNMNNQSVALLTKSLRSFANISDQMYYITRYELRPALNLLDDFRWQATRHASLVHKTLNIINQERKGNVQQMIQWLQKGKFPSISDSAGEHENFYRCLSEISFCIINVVLAGNEDKFKSLVDDFMSEAAQTLVMRGYCLTAWREGLEQHVDLILPEFCAIINRNSANAKELAAIVAEGEKYL